MQEFRDAIPGEELVEASPDFVGVTDVADLIGCSRQSIRKLMVTCADSFPAAVPEGSQSLWHLRPVLLWFARTQQRAIDRGLIDVSGVTMSLNIAKEVRRLPDEGLPDDLDALFA